MFRYKIYNQARKNFNFTPLSLIPNRNPICSISIQSTRILTERLPLPRLNIHVFFYLYPKVKTNTRQFKYITKCVSANKNPFYSILLNLKLNKLRLKIKNITYTIVCAQVCTAGSRKYFYMMTHQLRHDLYCQMWYIHNAVFICNSVI